MRRPCVMCLRLAPALVFLGCSSGADDTVMTRRIALMNDVSAAFENVADMASYKQAKKHFAELQHDMRVLDEKIDGWSEDRKKAMERKHRAEIQAARDRMGLAIDAAATKANSKDKSPASIK